VHHKFGRDVDEAVETAIPFDRVVETAFEHCPVAFLELIHPPWITNTARMPIVSK